MNTENPIDTRIVRFIQKHHVLTLATCIESEPWCANCFYVFLPEEETFVYSSDLTTRHAKEAIKNKTVAGSVVLETNKPGLIQGLQLQGVMEKIHKKEQDKFERAYLKKFPYARLMTTELWLLKPTFLKFTDNRLGFGKKIIWQCNK